MEVQSMNGTSVYKILLAFVLSLAWAPAWAQNVLVTPVGSHAGEFCRNDRALIFEDPAGLRILYDPGRTVMGGGDSRLGHIDVMLLSHVHVDHLGDKAIPTVNAGACGADTATVSKTPNSNFAEIADAKGAKVLVGGEMAAFLLKKIKAVNSSSTATTQVLRPGGKFTMGDVTFATVPAKHSNGVDPGFLTDPEKTELAADGLTAYVGPEEGYVIQFSNGLVVYLSGDTGIIGDMETIVRQYYGAKLAVINIGDIFSTGPEEAAFAVNQLIKPESVIPSHANEAATSGGVVLPGTKTQRFIDLVGANRVDVPLSGVTMEYNSAGKCVHGC
jgi:L-ascorbate metabolism protein UlaG (beta-lactamase superfamily)